MTMISKIVGTMLIFGTLLAVWIDERSYLAKSLQKSRDSHEIAKDEPQTHDICTNTHECVKDTHDKTEPPTEADWKEVEIALIQMMRETNAFGCMDGYEDEPNCSEKPNNCEAQTCDNCKLKGTTKWCDNQVVCRAYKPKTEA